MVGFHDASSSVIKLHFFNPLSSNDSHTRNIRSDFANGLHVVIFGLSDACKLVMDMHRRKPLSLILHAFSAHNFRNESQNGAHVDIFGLLFAFRNCRL